MSLTLTTTQLSEEQQSELEEQCGRAREALRVIFNVTNNGWWVKSKFGADGFRNGGGPADKNLRAVKRYLWLL